MRPSPATLQRLLKYDPYTGVVYWRVCLSWRRPIGSVVGWLEKDTRYIRTSINGRHYGLHQIIWAMQTGSWPKSQIDHKNKIRDDNRWENLREATRSQNQHNSKLRTDNTSGVKNISKYRKGWRIQFRLHNKLFSQNFKSFDAAVAAAEALPNRGLI